MKESTRNIYELLKKIKEGGWGRAELKKEEGPLLWWTLSEEGLINHDTDPIELTKKGENILKTLKERHADEL